MGSAIQYLLVLIADIQGTETMLNIMSHIGIKLNSNFFASLASVFSS